MTNTQDTDYRKLTSDARRAILEAIPAAASRAEPAGLHVLAQAYALVAKPVD